MTKLGRNDPCSCGSGKKYKKCCLASDEVSKSQNRRLHNVEADLLPRLLEHALETFGVESMLEAWTEFNDDGSYDENDPDSQNELHHEYDPAAPMNSVFIPWFLFSRTIITMSSDDGSIPEDTTVAESFMAVHSRSLGREELALLSAANRSRFTFCEIREVNPGVGMKQFDLLRQLEFEVIDPVVSQTIRRGDIMYCATIRLDQVTSNLGTGPYSLRPTTKRDILELRDWMLADSESDEITDEHLDDYEVDIRDLYQDSLDYMLDSDPGIRNTDLDPLVPQKLYFKISSPELAFHALKDLAEGVDESDLLLDAQSENGSLRSVEIPWFGGNEQTRKLLGCPIMLGVLKIKDLEMIVDVDSNERAELIRRLIEERLGIDATYQMTLIDPLPPLDSIDEDLAAAAGVGEEAIEEILSILDDAPPELLAELGENNLKGWETWFDEPISALNNLTPREAAKTERGRDLLESVLCEYESLQSALPGNPFTPDIAALRRELDLE